MPSYEKVTRRSILAGAVGAVGVAALPSAAAASSAGRRYPSPWPELEPYGLADTRLDLWPRDDNSFVLPLEHRPRDAGRKQVWMRDTYVNCFRVGGRPVYVATGTTRAAGVTGAGPWNDGIFVWVAPSMHGPWRLADTTGIRPGAEKGKVWSPEFVTENRPGRTVVAPWQEYHHIDGGLYTEGDDAWLVLHNNLYAKFTDDLEDIVPSTGLPAFQQTPYSPEPYLEGAYVFKHGGKYYLLHAAWDRASTDRNAYDPAGPGRVQYQYDAVMAVSDHFEGPYSRRWTAGVGAGHNNIFADADGHLWATFFRNPRAGYWADPARVDQAAVPGVVRMEWTGPGSNRIYVRRRAGVS